MPAKIFLLSNKADKAISKFPLKIQNKIDKAFDKLKINPLAGAKLGGELGGKYKFRIGDYRIVYKFNPKESRPACQRLALSGRLEIVKIEHRQGVYR